MENLKNIISKIDVPLFIIYGFMGFGSIYIAAFIRERMDLSFWAELFVCVLIISPFYFLVRIAMLKHKEFPTLALKINQIL